MSRLDTKTHETGHPRHDKTIVGEDMKGRSFKAWERELTGVILFLNKLPGMTAVEGSKWVMTTTDYYKKRHNSLIMNHPRLPRGYKLPKLL